MDQMRIKRSAGHFRPCPRNLCGGEPMLPTGPSDVLGVGTAQGYCPRCRDVYNDPRETHDGAPWGTTFPHLFLECNSDLAPRGELLTYTPRIFGFRMAQHTLDSDAG
mmetsp:Transcript_21325/g.42275  ORF Transcript_21325/g.42275 Transcript_21325/m.42275 type:complete len:107 (+) Transcript_21325:289-609(+)